MTGIVPVPLSGEADRVFAEQAVVNKDRFSSSGGPATRLGNFLAPE
jgi:hypothetical protein